MEQLTIKLFIYNKVKHEWCMSCFPNIILVSLEIFPRLAQWEISRTKKEVNWETGKYIDRS